MSVTDHQDESTDLPSVLIRDHRRIDGMFKQLESSGLDDATREEVTARVIAELVSHEVAEERYLYPPVCAWVEGGPELVDRALAEYVDAEKSMRELAGLSATDAQFEPLLSRLTRTMRAHASRAEHDLLLRLSGACSQQDLDALGAMALTTTATTRASGAAGQDEPVPDARLVDRVRDTLARRAPGQ